jgi:hypothetical protein
LKELTKRTTFVRVAEQDRIRFLKLRLNPSFYRPLRSLDAQRLWDVVQRSAQAGATGAQHHEPGGDEQHGERAAGPGRLAGDGPLRSDEVEDFVAISQALVINIGTLDAEQIAACKLAASESEGGG